MHQSTVPRRIPKQVVNGSAFRGIKQMNVYTQQINTVVIVVTLMVDSKNPQ